MFHIGEKIIYPAHGIGIIDRIEEKIMIGRKESFYIIKIVENGATIMTPMDNADKVGLRGIASKKDVNKVLKIIRKVVPINLNENWNRRQKGYFNKIKTGSLFEIAEVYRDLCLLETEKGLSFGERKMLENARNLIICEIAEAKGIKLEKAERLVKKSLN
ncbi:MAG: hypothetical protein A3I04_02740 [Nitrospinae bacterium RIFCSPLOWO2_02_FULL_39_110]|nr:MAG: hypothetical protein A2W53_03570 [Nitrospinae bacterium RIFCSPHIGHO2_02_39_11]OGV99759.1 MAG: hypothetical protein A3D20_00490 [Nitrospinae bacterium RIFCSPHIGHO2_02_FULL_39_82]OGW00076.1 MAG: hypothetical protein A3D97_08295 [Nitrospinae bacterium RIFCSPHIGHO2_12_FULL_39_42]OGW02048.1 MAG: hypothetical protein A2Z59_00705 [Nitrospinae bacterium RIFCSPLOWO2_02_39_17]OGW05503.1 MAG: hypothetical protein A3I04_02740 [Nitrospinae bacterium RIFCSPLOWO2_02_FULL_39_110]OGW10914.1 MAG: hypoth